MTAEILAQQFYRSRGLWAPVAGDGGAGPGPGGSAPWATDAQSTAGVFHTSQSRSDHEAFETFLGRTLKFTLRFLTSGWANDGLERPTAWDDPRPGKNTIAAYQNVLNLSSDWFINRPDVTQVVTFPAFPAGLNYTTALSDPDTEDFWTDLGTWCRLEGLLGTHPDGRPFLMIRGPGHENDGSWYNWGMRHTTSASAMNGGSIVLNAPLRKAYCEQVRTWFETGAGPNADRVMWIENVMAADLGESLRDALAANVPDSCDTYSQDSYDDYSGTSNYGTDASPKTQAQKDSAYNSVQDKILNGRTGRRWGVITAHDNGKCYAIDESGAYFDDPPGARRSAGGDHAFPAINWYQTNLNFFNETNGPQDLGILSHHFIYNGRTSGGQGTTQINPAQSFSPNSRLAALAAY